MGLTPMVPFVVPAKPTTVTRVSIRPTRYEANGQHHIIAKLVVHAITIQPSGQMSHEVFHQHGLRCWTEDNYPFGRPPHSSTTIPARRDNELQMADPIFQDGEVVITFPQILGWRLMLRAPVHGFLLWWHLRSRRIYRFPEYTRPPSWNPPMGHSPAEVSVPERDQLVMDAEWLGEHMGMYAAEAASTERWTWGPPSMEATYMQQDSLEYTRAKNQLDEEIKIAERDMFDEMLLDDPPEAQDEYYQLIRRKRACSCRLPGPPNEIDMVNA
ncbi:MAG: hypothetical protein M1824_002511 [Vezdaea acicularis]|nr:MAG: hypothetical protein M1824_002511 [Vezdaea acicularis]